MIIDLFDGKPCEFLMEHEFVKGLKEFLDRIWAERPLFNEMNGEKSKSQPFLKFEEGYIFARNYTGFIQYKDLRINIYPRVFCNIDPFDSSLIIRHVLKWLSYSKRINFPISHVDIDTALSNDWLESLVFAFACLTKSLVNIAPHFSYEEITEEMLFIRGRIAMSEYIRQNILNNRLHAIHCTHNPFVYDNLFNRIIKYTCRLLLYYTRERRNADLLKDILFTLDEVSNIPCAGADCDRVMINRLYPEMDKVRNLCKMFLYHLNIQSLEDIKGGLCMLLPMEVVFEQYVAGFIETHFPEYNSQSQASNEYLAAIKDESSTVIPVFRMKHDILLPDHSVIDTKYKFRHKDNTQKASINQADMYQILAYCLKRDMRQGMLLYPSHQDMDAENNSQSFTIDSPSFSTLIRAESIKITESTIEDFDLYQKKKFCRLFSS